MMVLSNDVDTRLALFTPNRRPVTAAVWASNFTMLLQSDELYTLHTHHGIGTHTTDTRSGHPSTRTNQHTRYGTPPHGFQDTARRRVPDGALAACSEVRARVVEND